MAFLITYYITFKLSGVKLCDLKDMYIILTEINFGDMQSFKMSQKAWSNSYHKVVPYVDYCYFSHDSHMEPL